MLTLVLHALASGFGIHCPKENLSNGELSKKPRFGDSVKVAIYADVGHNENSEKVMKMTKNWGAQISIIAGDFDYDDNPTAFVNMFEQNVGAKAPLLVAPGNHDILKWYEPHIGYRALFKKHSKKSKIHQYCAGDFGIQQYCLIDNMLFVMSGIGTMGSGHVEFLDSVLSRYQHIPWKFCIWHKNQRLLQTGEKTDETGYEVYETCRKYGAMVFTGHEHSYARTHLLSNFENQTIFSTSNHLELRPGVSFATVAGLGGIEIRGWKNDRQTLSHWAATAAADVI
jgi:3',5'-cyclic AMP phosphodiesterase CpdA